MGALGWCYIYQEMLVKKDNERLEYYIQSGANLNKIRRIVQDYEPTMKNVNAYLDELRK